MKRKKKAHSTQHRSAEKLWLGIKTAFLSAVVILLVATLVVTLHQQFASTGPYRMEYEGRVIDKSVTITESQTGSYPVRRLLIKSKSGEEFQVIVNQSLYERAQVGMWIKSSKAGAELSLTEP